jgi:hypothetical protein
VVPTPYSSRNFPAYEYLKHSFGNPPTQHRKILYLMPVEAESPKGRADTVATASSRAQSVLGKSKVRQSPRVPPVSSKDPIDLLDDDDDNDRDTAGPQKTCVECKATYDQDICEMVICALEHYVCANCAARARKRQHKAVNDDLYCPVCPLPFKSKTEQSDDGNTVAAEARESANNGKEDDDAIAK